MKTKILAFGISLFLSLFIQAKTPQNYTLDKALLELKNFDNLAQSQVMVVGTLHFNSSVLTAKNQASIKQFNELLSRYQPTKIVLEWEPSKQDFIDKSYQSYLSGQFDISQKPNEVYQLGFQLAQRLKHKQVYLFDDQTEFIGSLENFSFEAFSKYANANDPGFYNKYEKTLTENFNFNQKLLKSLSLDNQMLLLNSPEHQKFNEQRMHMYEVRVGIQKNWLGPDWLGRWYQRNIRMLGNVLKLTEKNDRILIIVGDNHKWVLDSLFAKTPDIELVSSWHFLNKQLKLVNQGDS